MRLQLIYRPSLLVQRIAQSLRTRQRLAKLKGTVAAGLSRGHIDTLELLELMRIEAPRTIYDIGANVGTWTLLAKALFPQAVIHAFEPLPAHCKKFQAACGDVPGVTLHSIALGSAAGRSAMNIASVSDASSLLDMAAESLNQYGLTVTHQEEVTVGCLDEYVQANNLPHPDLIKLDVQGYELEALRGSLNCLKHARWILSEVSFVTFYKNQVSFEALVAFLSSVGFELYAFSDTTPCGHQLIQTDALFSRKDVHP